MNQPKVGRAWQRWTEDEARAALGELARNGESAEAFARRRGISTQRLRYWKKRLAGSATAEPAFVALTLPEVPMARQLEVRIDEVVIAVHGGFDVAQVASLVAAIIRRRRAC